MKWLDVPPVWLLAGLALARAMAEVPGQPLLGPWAGWAGPMLVLAGMAAMAAAAWEFQRARTTIVPHRAPRALISKGIYRWSRNPIYLADVLILAGAVLYWRAVLPLVLVPALVWILRVRFVLPEEARLRGTFGAAFKDYAARTRRWI